MTPLEKKISAMMRQPWNRILLDSYSLRKPGRRELVRQILRIPTPTAHERALMLVHTFALEGFDQEIERGLRARQTRVRMIACSAAASLHLMIHLEEIALIAASDPSSRDRFWAIVALRRLGDGRWISHAAEPGGLPRLNCYEKDDWREMQVAASRILASSVDT